MSSKFIIRIAIFPSLHAQNDKNEKEKKNSTKKERAKIQEIVD
jgi:hypothetical protein